MQCEDCKYSSQRNHPHAERDMWLAPETDDPLKHYRKMNIPAGRGSKIFMNPNGAATLYNHWADMAEGTVTRWACLKGGTRACVCLWWWWWWGGPHGSAVGCRSAPSPNPSHCVLPHLHSCPFAVHGRPQPSLTNIEQSPLPNKPHTPRHTPHAHHREVEGGCAYMAHMVHLFYYRPTTVGKDDFNEKTTWWWVWDEERRLVFR